MKPKKYEKLDKVETADKANANKAEEDDQVPADVCEPKDEVDVLADLLQRQATMSTESDYTPWAADAQTRSRNFPNASSEYKFFNLSRNG